MIHLEGVLKASWRRYSKTSWRCLENVLKKSWRRIIRRIYSSRSRRLDDVLKTHEQCKHIVPDDHNVFKTFSEDKDERRLQDVFTNTNLKPSLTSMMEFFAKIVNGVISFIIFAKKLHYRCSTGLKICLWQG